LAIFPAIAAFVSLYGLIADASTIDSHLSLASGILPAGAVDILHEQITRLTAKSDAKLGLGFITGLAIALWSANAGMKAIIDALNVVYDEKEKRSFVKLNLLSLLFTIIAMVSLMGALAAVVIAPIVFSAVGMMMWMWISAIVILLGGELNAEIEHQTAHDSTVGSEKPLGERGAVMADTIGAAR
jgi:membrane protein